VKAVHDTARWRRNKAVPTGPWRGAGHATAGHCAAFAGRVSLAATDPRAQASCSVCQDGHTPFATTSSAQKTHHLALWRWRPQANSMCSVASRRVKSGQEPRRSGVPVSIIARSDIKLDAATRPCSTVRGLWQRGGAVDEPPPAGVAGARWRFCDQPCPRRRYPGDAWHMAGHKTTKFNTWRDGIATAEWLIANGYTSSKRLAVYGGSAGASLWAV